MEKAVNLKNGVPKSQRDDMTESAITRVKQHTRCREFKLISRRAILQMEAAEHVLGGGAKMMVSPSTRRSGYPSGSGWSGAVAPRVRPAR